MYTGYMERYKQSLAQTAVAAYANIASKHGLTPTELALAYCYTREHVTSTIIGATSIPQLKENIEAYYKRDKITPEVIEAIELVYKQYRDPSKV